MSEESSSNTAIRTIDQLLSHYSKVLEAGQSISFPLFKGATTQSVDPLKRVVRSKIQDVSGQDVSKDSLFPRIAKFTETTTKPNFLTQPWKEARLCEEDVPKVIDEEEAEDGLNPVEATTAATNNNNTSSTAATETAQIKPKKRRWKRFEPPKRHWVLQEPKELKEKLYIKKLMKTDPTMASSLEKKIAARLSQQYHGSSEDKSTSHYAILSLQNNMTNHSGNTQETSFPENPSDSLAITVTTIHGFHNFTQPYKTRTLSMQDAENFISDRRFKMDRYMKLTSILNGTGDDKEAGHKSAKAAAAEAIMECATSGGSLGMFGPTLKGGLAKARLFNKLINQGSSSGKSTKADDGDDDDDDVMADIAFRETKGIGRTARARKELLSTFGGDGSLAIDDDGVIGGANDSEFGGRRQVFNRFVQSERERDQETDDVGEDDIMMKSSENGLEDRAGAASTIEGTDLDENFYQQDIAMKYEDLDYDVDERFDNNDVDIGSDENEDIGEFTADVEEDDDGDMEDDDIDEDDNVFTMGQSPLKDMGKATTLSDAGSTTDKSDDEQSLNPPQKKMKVADDLPSQSKFAQSITPVVHLDENGDRVLVLDAVRKEIWLHSGRILVQKLAKIYNINNKNTERRTKFLGITKELCNAEDTKDGKMLVLKQHYFKLG